MVDWNGTGTRASARYEMMPEGTILTSSMNCSKTDGGHLISNLLSFSSLTSFGIGIAVCTAR